MRHRSSSAPISSIPTSNPRQLPNRSSQFLPILSKPSAGFTLASVEEVDGGVSRFVWLRRFEVGQNSADINALLDRLEFLQGFDLPSDLLETVPPHRIARLRRQGERYFTDGLRDISGDRRLAICAVCAVEWRGAIADAVVETHDRIVGQTFRSAQRRSDARIQDSKTVLRDTLASFRTLGAALLEAEGDGTPLEEAVAAAGG